MQGARIAYRVIESGGFQSANFVLSGVRLNGPDAGEFCKQTLNLEAGNFARYPLRFKHPPSTVTDITIIATFASLALVTSYPLIGLSNVKLIDLLVFLAAFLFGLRIGLGVAASTRVIYGLLNPLGSADIILLIFLVAGESFYALAGAGLRKTTTAKDFLGNGRFLGRFSLVFGTIGLLATLAFDVLTNFASWLFLTPSLYDSLILGNVAGAPFSLIHEVSNLVLFSTAAPSAIIATKRFARTILPLTRVF